MELSIKELAATKQQQTRMAKEASRAKVELDNLLARVRSLSQMEPNLESGAKVLRRRMADLEEEMT